MGQGPEDPEYLVSFGVLTAEGWAQGTRHQIGPKLNLFRL